jgi:hypothetical protein
MENRSGIGVKAFNIFYEKGCWSEKVDNVEDEREEVAVVGFMPLSS